MTDSATVRESPETVAHAEVHGGWVEEVFRAHARFVANTLRRFGVSPNDIADQVQEVFFVVFRIQGSYDRARPLKPWLFGISYRVAGRYRQAQGRGPAASDDIDDVVVADRTPLADAEIEAKEAQALVLAALERVDLSRRAVLILADLEGEPIPVIAEALQIPLNTAYSRLRLAREEFERAVTRLCRKHGERT